MLAAVAAQFVAFVVLWLIVASIGAPAERWLRARAQWFARLGRRKTAATLVVGAFAFLVGATLTAIALPVPGVHDEFCNLLAADTFVQGRLTNPTHPMWVHFESFHIIHQPTYASKYFPAQGLWLALGQVFTGQPIVAVWLSSALAAAATCWMLQGWVSGKWALVGGLLVASHPTVQFVWGQSYWGGTIALIGSALVLGAWGRLRHAPSIRQALLLALGAVILAGHRPYEGFFVCLPVALAICQGLLTRRWSTWRGGLLRVALPALAVLLVGLSCLGYYNARVTGSPLTMPYQVHEKTYAVSPLFFWQGLRPVPHYNHRVIESFHRGWELRDYERQQTWRGFLGLKAEWLARIAYFIVTPTLCIPLLLGLRPGTHREQRLITAMLVISLVAVAAIVWPIPHYCAPAIPLLLLITVRGLRRLRTWRVGAQRRGLVLVPLVLTFYGFLFAIGFAARARSEHHGWQWDRAQTVQRLEQEPGRHLVVVHYRPDHNPIQEWVYNRADIDQAKIVWARAMSPAEDLRLLEYFPDRRVWRLEVDRQPPELQELPETSSEQRTGPGQQQLLPSGGASQSLMTGK